MAFEAKQTSVLGTHDGFEAQAIRGASHHRPHGCPVTSAVSLTQDTGAKVGERPRCGLLLGLPGQGVRSRCLGALDHASSRRLRSFWIWPHSTNMSDSIISGRRTTKKGSQRRLLASWCASHEGWRFLEADNHVPFLGLRDHSSQVAVGPPQQPNSCWQLFWKWCHLDSQHTGSGMLSTTFRGT